MEGMIAARLRYRAYKNSAFKMFGSFISKTIKSFIHYSIGTNEKEA